MPASVRIKAGELRQIIQIVQPTLAQDSFGGWQIDADNLYSEVWAKVEALNGRELYAAQQKISEVTHRITIRWMPGVKAKQNVWFDSREFQIEAVENPDEIQHLLYLLCIERDDSAREAAGGSSGSVPTPISQPVVFTCDGTTETLTLPYTPPQGILLWWNGSLQASPTDYSISGTQITLARTPMQGDVVQVLYL